MSWEDCGSLGPKASPGGLPGFHGQLDSWEEVGLNTGTPAAAPTAVCWGVGGGSREAAVAWPVGWASLCETLGVTSGKTSSLTTGRCLKDSLQRRVL